MGKQDEIDYYKRIGPDGQRHADGKPFTDENCGEMLVSIGQIMTLLPRPPARLLDLGSGTGWTSEYFARLGYAVTGLDIALDMARAAARLRSLPRLNFLVGDFESIPTTAAFDTIVSFGAVHHAENVTAALSCCKRALKPNGSLILMEPGKGHSESDTSRRATSEFGVTERSLPPAFLKTELQALGFREIEIIPRLDLFVAPLAKPQSERNWKYRLAAGLAGRRMANAIQLYRSTTKNAALVRARA